MLSGKYYQISAILGSTVLTTRLLQSRNESYHPVRQGSLVIVGSALGVGSL